MLPQLLFACNTMVHQSTGHSPYEFMFGQKPQLPVDLLLGQAEEEPSSTTPDDWVKEHQDHLASVYVAARKNLDAAAKAREQLQPPTTTSILPVGTLIYRMNHGQGRRKIQDVWESTSCTKWWNVWIRWGRYTESSPAITRNSRRTSITHK